MSIVFIPRDETPQLSNHLTVEFMLHPSKIFFFLKETTQSQRTSGVLSPLRTDHFHDSFNISST